MKVLNKETGDIEGLPYDVAISSVEAGTHVIVNEDEDGKTKSGKAKAPVKAEAKK